MPFLSCSICVVLPAAPCRSFPARPSTPQYVPARPCVSQWAGSLPPSRPVAPRTPRRSPALAPAPASRASRSDDTVSRRPPGRIIQRVVGCRTALCSEQKHMTVPSRPPFHMEMLQLGGKLSGRRAVGRQRKAWAGDGERHSFSAMRLLGSLEVDLHFLGERGWWIVSANSGCNGDLRAKTSDPALRRKQRNETLRSGITMQTVPLLAGVTRGALPRVTEDSRAQCDGRGK